MRRLVLGLLGAVVALALGLPAAAQTSPTPTPSTSPTPEEPEIRFALQGEARGLELAITEQGVTLGAAVAEMDSEPATVGLGAGQCELLGEQGAATASCTDETSERSSYPDGERGDSAESCAAPTLPAPLNTLIHLNVACGFSRSGVIGDFPATQNYGYVSTVALDFDLSGLSQELEDAKDQVVDGLQDLIDPSPQQIRSALNALLDALEQGEAGRIEIGRATSDISAAGDTVEVSSTAGGVSIGLIGIPDLNQQGQPIPDTANALEDGLIIVEIGDAFSNASVNAQSQELTADADAATVVVKVRDITQYPDVVYQEQRIAPDQTLIILPGTPLESTITAAVAQHEISEGSARAASDSARAHLLQGDEFQGGIQLGVARTTAGASIAQEVVPTPPPTEEPLPATGRDDRTGFALVLILLALALLLSRRRLNRR